jgi:hypothetical protein
MQEKMKRYRERQAVLGRKPRTLYLTEAEFDLAKTILEKLRSKENDRNQSRTASD